MSSKRSGQLFLSVSLLACGKQAHRHSSNPLRTACGEQSEKLALSVS
jgi:hypothetical protein